MKITVESTGFIVLTILFVGLKLAGFIVWSWWWVLSPLWIGAIIMGIFLLFCLLMWMIFDR